MGNYLGRMLEAAYRLKLVAQPRLSQQISPRMQIASGLVAPCSRKLIEIAMLSDEQEAFVSKLEVVRLRDGDVTDADLATFRERKGSTLGAYLREYARFDDLQGQTAVYVVRNKDDHHVVLFFSLHCGALFEPFDIKENIAVLISQVTKLSTVLSSPVRSVSPPDVLEYCISDDQEQIQDLTVSLQPPDLDQRVMTIRTSYNAKLFYKADVELEGDTNNIHRVRATIPGLELVHLALDESVRVQWRSLAGANGARHPIGAYIYWKHILPKVKEVCALAGCRVLFLFAADSTSESTLVAHYMATYGFAIPKDQGVAKPYYDWTCRFLSADIDTLLQKREEYFADLEGHGHEEDIV